LLLDVYDVNDLKTIPLLCFDILSSCFN